jgi:hypothetical protein
MVEILPDAFNGKDFFAVCVGTNDFGPFGYPAFIAVFGINLPYPAGIPIAGCTYQDLGVEIAKVEGLRIGLGGFGHGSSDEKARSPNLKVDGGVQIFRAYPICYWKSYKFLMWQDTHRYLALQAMG